MNLTMIELRRTFRSRVVLAAVVFLLVMDVFVYGNTGNSYYTVFGKDSKAHIAEAQEDGAYFKGEVTDQWIAWVTGEADAIRNNPANQLQGDEREAMKQKLADQGFEVVEHYPVTAGELEERVAYLQLKNIHLHKLISIFRHIL